jgi:putative membrane protein
MLILGFIVTIINPIYPNEQGLQHLGTLVISIPLLVDLRENKLPFYTFLALTIFILFHIIGARYIYSYVPYNDWFLQSIGFDVDQLFNFNRNHYDRFIHFLFGLLFSPYVFYIVKKLLVTKDLRWILFVTWLTIQTISMFYELFEWALTLVMTSDAAEYYNGQQGDMWDAHKDMSLALLGSIIFVMYVIIRKNFFKNSILF